jgi:hypothetical protein
MSRRFDAPDWEILRQKLAAVRWRVLAGRLFSAVFLYLLIAFAFFVLYLLAERLLALGLDPLWSFLIVSGTALMVGVIRGGIFGWPSLFQTALLVDERLRLKERVSSAVYLHSQKGSVRDPGAEIEALVERDGIRSLSQRDLRGHFPVQLPRSALGVLFLLGLLLLIPMVVPPLDLFGFRSARMAQAVMKEEAQKTIEDFREKFEELKNSAEDVPDPELKKVMEAVEKRAQELVESERKPQEPGGEKGDAAKKEALLKFTQLEDLLKEKLEKGDFEDLKDFLENLQGLAVESSALTRGLQEALKKGDFATASGELKKLRSELSKLLKKQKEGSLSPEDLEKLARLSRELKRLSRNSAALSKLSSSLSGLSQGLSMQDLAQALQSLERLDMNMQSLEQLLRQMQFLDQSLSLVKLSKGDLARLHRCPNCGKLRKGPMKPGGT